MATRKLAIVVLLLAQVTSVQIAQASIRGDEHTLPGCVWLSIAVYEEVSNIGQLPVSGLALPGTVVPESQQCDLVREVVTAAFTDAMATLNLSIGWGGPAPGPSRGDVCLSHHLSECYPERYTIGGTAALTAFMYSSWQAVQKTSLGLMQQGSDANVAIFDVEQFRQELRRSLTELSGGGVDEYWLKAYRHSFPNY